MLCHTCPGPGRMGGLRVRCAECGTKTSSAAQVCVVCGAPAMARPSVAVDPAATGLSGTGDHRASRGRQVALALLPVVSVTILAWWPFLVLALIRRRARDWPCLPPAWPPWPQR